VDVTISLEAHQAEQLRAKAAARGQSPEQAARALVIDGLARSADEERWGPLNDRRCALIEKGRSTTLTADEQAELDALQAALDARLEGVDLRRIAQAEMVLQRMKELRDAARP
jgi:hypothetical protein